MSEQVDNNPELQNAIDHTETRLGELAARTAILEHKAAQLREKAHKINDELEKIDEESNKILSKISHPFRERLKALDQLPSDGASLKHERVIELSKAERRLEDERAFICEMSALGALEQNVRSLIQKHIEYIENLENYHPAQIAPEEPPKSKLHSINLLEEDYDATYPALFPSSKLNDTSYVISTISQIAAKTYPPEILQYVSFEATKDNRGTVSYFMRVHTTPQHATDVL